MRKVVIINSSPFLSGAEISMLQLLEKIDAKHDLMIISGNIDHFKNIKLSHAVEVLTIVNKVPWLKFLRKTFKINFKSVFQIVKFKPDVIYFNTTNSFLNFFWIGIFFLRVKNVWHVRDSLKNKRWVLRVLEFFSSVIVCNSEFISNQFHDIAKKKIVYGGIDVNHYKPQLSISNRKTNYKVVGCVAQFTPWKNQIDFIKAAEIIYKNNNNVEFLLVGDILNPKEATYKEYLLKEVSSRGLNGVINFVGFQKDIINMLSRIDVLIHPAIDEPFGRVVIEAMSMEIPVVAYNSGGIKEIVIDEETGYLVPPFAYEKLALQTSKLLNSDKLRIKMGSIGRKRVVERFSLEKHVKEMKILFDKD
ncbi:glycosyltransferase family 4 protein [Snuella sedimenti]|uniref:Glycosyltransferase family 4 protein n=1 Tax=Snuella sedimenti TaxID=2798802 RepID=A0A8J7IGZ0_9FLAO|nr:glycosyltransferase family 4 protein [Snuella sedimenti]MBJ6369812.1 glycosyltransferase family 4 protein [Snuella sedimenti]